MHDEDIVSLMIRLDSNGDGKISYYKFIDAIIPIGQEMKYRDRLLSTGEIIKQRVKSPEKQRTSQIDQEKKDISFQNTVKTNDPRTQSKKESSFKDKSNEIKIDESLDMGNKSAQNITQSKEKYYSKKHQERQSNENRSTALNNSISFRTLSPSPIKKNGEKILNSGINHDVASIKLNITNSPLKNSEEEYLATVMKNQLDLDKELEEIREDLAIKTDFNLMDAFRFFDSNGKGFITSSELDQTLQLLDVFADSTEIYLIMRKYDADGDGLLRYLLFSIKCDF